MLHIQKYSFLGHRYHNIIACWSASLYSTHSHSLVLNKNIRTCCCFPIALIFPYFFKIWVLAKIIHFSILPGNNKGKLQFLQSGFLPMNMLICINCASHEKSNFLSFPCSIPPPTFPQKVKHCFQLRKLMHFSIKISWGRGKKVLV